MLTNNIHSKENFVKFSNSGSSLPRISGKSFFSFFAAGLFNRQKSDYFAFLLLQMRNKYGLTAFSTITGIAKPVLNNAAVLGDGLLRTRPLLITRTSERVQVLRCRAATWRCAIAMPSYFAFDKVPQGLPDWWNEDEDDDDGNDGNLDSSFSEPARRGLGKFEETDVGDGGGLGGVGGGKSDGGRSGGGGGGGGGSGDGGDGGNGNKSNPFGAAFTWYLNALSKYPIRTKTISTFILAVLGDIIAQYVAHDKDTPYHHDVRRTVSMGIWALIFMGPVLHYWYTYLDKAVKGRLSLVKKLLVDQLVFAPTFHTTFMFGTGLLEGNSWKSTVETWRTKIIPTLKANYTLWPAIQSINFTFIPPKLQVLFINCFSLLWNCIITYITHDDVETPSSVKKVVD